MWGSVIFAEKWLVEKSLQKDTFYFLYYTLTNTSEAVLSYSYLSKEIESVLQSFFTQVSVLLLEQRMCVLFTPLLFSHLFVWEVKVAEFLPKHPVLTEDLQSGRGLSHVNDVIGIR